MPRQNILETERTFLTLLTEEDLPAMTEMAGEPDTFKYLRKLRIMTAEEYQQFLRVKLEQIRSGTGFHWAVWLKGTPVFIGAVNLNPVAGTPMMQIGCQLRRDYWHQGFASELTRRILDFAMEEVGVATVYGLFQKENQASRRLLEKLGFEWQETWSEPEVTVEVWRYPAGDASDGPKPWNTAPAIQ